MIPLKFVEIYYLQLNIPDSVTDQVKIWGLWKPNNYICITIIYGIESIYEILILEEEYVVWIIFKCYTQIGETKVKTKR